MKIVRFAHSLFLPESFYTSKAHFGKRFRRSVQRPQTAPNSQMRPALPGRLRLSTFGMHDCIPATHADAAALPVGHVLYCVARGTSRITRDQNAMSQRARARESAIYYNANPRMRRMERHDLRLVDKFRLSRLCKSTRSSARQHISQWPIALLMHFKFTIQALGSLPIS